MGTPENAATEKAGTSTSSSDSPSPTLPPARLRAEAPRIETLEDLARRNEQVLDGLDRGTLTPKTAEQMNQTLKAIFRLKVDVPLRLMSLLAKHKGKVPIPREPILRKMIGLGEQPAPTDAKTLEDATR